MKFKKDKKKAFGWFGTLNPDAGNVELNNKIFNSASNASESPSTNPTGPMAEAKQTKYYDPEYDRVVDETVIEKQWEKIKASGYTYAKSYEEFRDQNFEKINESTDYDPRNYEIKAEVMLENEYGEDIPVELINKHKYYLDFEPQYILKYKVWVDEDDPDKVIYVIITTGTKKLHEFDTEAEADAYWDKFFEDDDLHESVNSEYAVIKHYYDPRVGFEKFIYKVVEVVDETELGGIEYRVKGSAERGFVSKSNVVKKFNTKAEADDYIKTLHEDINDVDLYTLDALSYYFGKLVTEEDVSDYTADEIERAEDYYSLKDFSPSERTKIFATKWKNNKKIADNMTIVENVSKTNFYKITLQDTKDDRTWSVAVEGESEEDAKALSNAFIDGDSIKIIDSQVATADDVQKLQKVTKHPISEDSSDTDKLTTYYQIWAKGPSDTKFHFQDEYAYLSDLIEEAKGFMHGDAQVRVLEVEEDESGNIVKRNGEVLFYSDSAVQTVDKELFDVATPQETADMFGKKVYSKEEDKLYIPTGPVFEAARLSPEEKLERELEKLDKQASRFEAKAERCFDKDNEEGGWYWKDQADEIRRQMDMMLVTANLKEDYTPVDSFYAIEFDDEYEDNLSRKEVREKALDIIKNNKAESIYITKTSIYDQHGRQIKDFDDILEMYRDGEKWDIVLDKLSIAKLADLETTEKDLTEDVDDEVELEYDDLELEIYTGNPSGYFDIGFGNWLPDDSSKTVNIAYTYKVAQSAVEEFLYDFIEADIPQEELAKHIDDYDEFLEAYMKEHFDELFEKHKSKILDHFEEDAIDDAYENYEDDDGYDYDPYDDYEPDYED